MKTVIRRDGRNGRSVEHCAECDAKVEACQNCRKKETVSNVGWSGRCRGCERAIKDAQTAALKARRERALKS